MAETRNIQQDCPFPEVAESLRPYIRTRQEVTQNRRAHQASLPLSSIELLQADAGDRVDPASLNGVRKAYWRALQAHRAAQSKYDSLKAELSQMVHEPSPAANGTSTEDDSSFMGESYVPLMRQREKYRKLKVVESTFAKINASGDALGESFDKAMKRQVGELPVPPSAASLSEREPAAGAEYDLSQLKRAILSAQQQLEEHERRSNSANGVNGESGSRSELKALQKTHNELTTWMETQLGLISEVEGSSKEGSEDSKSLTESTNGTATHSSDEINELYELYLDARQRLLDTVANASTVTLDSPSMSDLARRGSDTQESQQRATASEILLPYMSDLISAKQREQSLLQSSAHTRRQMASAESQTKSVLTRLADESHLVQPELTRRSPQGKDWAKAATDATSATASAAGQRIKSGQHHADAAADSFEKIMSMPNSMDSVLK